MSTLCSALFGVQNPRPVDKRDIDALLPERRAKLYRQLVQHGLDRAIGQMAEIGVNGFTREQRYGFSIRADGAVWAWPCVGHFASREHARQRGLARFDAALHPAAGGPHS